MHYYFVCDKKGNIHIIVAKSIQNARQIAEKSKSDIAELYELDPDTFKAEGFLISDARRP